MPYSKYSAFSVFLHYGDKLLFIFCCYIHCPVTVQWSTNLQVIKVIIMFEKPSESISSFLFLSLSSQSFLKFLKTMLRNTLLYSLSSSIFTLYSVSCTLSFSLLFILFLFHTHKINQIYLKPCHISSSGCISHPEMLSDI